MKAPLFLLEYSALLSVSAESLVIFAFAGSQGGYVDPPSHCLFGVSDDLTLQ